MLKCKNCERCYHAKCLEPPLEPKLVRFDWYCTDCKTCNVCEKNTKDHELLICDCCDRAFHMFCLVPKRPSVPEGRW